MTFLPASLMLERSDLAMPLILVIIGLLAVSLTRLPLPSV